MLHHKSRSACGEIIHVRQILAELWSLTLRFFTHFSLSSQLLHSCMDLYETWQGCCTTSIEVHVGIIFLFDKFWQSYGPWHLEFLHIIACLLNSSYIVAWICMNLGRDVAPQVQKCMWGDNSCSANFGRVMALDTWNFYTFYSPCTENFYISILSYPASYIQHPTSYIQHPTSYIQHPTSNILHPTSSILHPTSSILHPASYIQHPT